MPKKRSKGLMIVMDGLGDRPIPELGSKTPLESAGHPQMDIVASRGITGLVDPWAPGIPCGTDVGHLCLLGYDPHEVYPGRGPIEAAGLGIDLEPGDVAFRCDIGTVDENGIVIDRRAGRIREGAAELAKSLNGMKLSNGVTALFLPATEHRAVLVLRGEGLSSRVSDSDPGTKHEGEPIGRIRPLDTSPEAHRTARALQEFIDRAHKILARHPVNLERISQGLLPGNAVLTRSPGTFRGLPALSQRYPGLTASCVAGENTVLAIAKLIGMTPVTGPGMTASFDFDPEAKVRAAANALSDRDLVLVHVKAPDLAGHDGRFDRKCEVIEKLDRLVGGLLEVAGDEMYVAIVSDHSTPCSLGDHSGDPVAAAICGPGVRVDQVQHFDERSCAQGGLGRISGKGFFNTLLDLMGFVEKCGS